MKLFVNERGEIRAVNTTDNQNLIELVVDDTAMDFPFYGFPDAKICCYKITWIEKENGTISITSMSLYVPDSVELVEQETPSQLDRVEAQEFYTVMMTDTLLEG